MLFFWIVYGTILLQRLGELFMASRNARLIRACGGYEVGAEHYKYIVLLHASFFASLLLEVWRGGKPFILPAWWYIPFCFFLSAQLLRYWCMYSLGRRWNTRILILPGAPPVTRGPYRYLRHPNYLVVAIELLTLPLTFAAYSTALVFTLLNAWVLLRIRIPLENRAVYEREKP